MLCSCELLTRHPKEARRSIKHYEMDAYLEKLSLARIILTNPAADSTTLRPVLDVIEGFAKKKQPTIIYQTAVVVTYHIKHDNKAQQVLIPISITPDYHFEDLEEIFSWLDGTSHTLDDIHPVTLVSLPPRVIKFPQDDMSRTKIMINEEIHLLLSKKIAFSATNEAELQVQLLAFFMNYHQKEAAYLAAENAEQSLAKAESNADAETDSIGKLSTRLEALETQLHQEMPFTLGNIK